MNVLQIVIESAPPNRLLVPYILKVQFVTITVVQYAPGQGPT